LRRASERSDSSDDGPPSKSVKRERSERSVKSDKKESQKSETRSKKMKSKGDTKQNASANESNPEDAHALHPETEFENEEARKNVILTIVPISALLLICANSVLFL